MAARRVLQFSKRSSLVKLGLISRHTRALSFWHCEQMLDFLEAYQLQPSELVMRVLATAS